MDSIEYFTLTTHAEEWIERVYHDGKSLLLVDEVYSALHTQVWRDALFNKERQ